MDAGGPAGSAEFFEIQPFDRLTAPSRVEGVIEVSAAEDEGASISEDSGVKVSYSDDVEATWTVRRKQPHHGYKVHMGTEVYLGGYGTAAHTSQRRQFFNSRCAPAMPRLDIPLLT